MVKFIDMSREQWQDWYMNNLREDPTAWNNYCRLKATYPEAVERIVNSFLDSVTK